MFVDLVDHYLVDHRHPLDDVDDCSVISADCGASKTLPGNMKVQAKLTLYFGTTAIYRGFSQLEMAGRLIRFMRNRTIRFKSDYIRLDAGSVVVDGGAVLLLGGRDHRVAALTAALVAKGASLLGDDVTLWEPVDRFLHPVGLPITLDGDLAHATFPETAPAPARRPRRRDESAVPRVWPVPLRPEDLGGSHAFEAAPIRHVLMVELHEGGPTTLEPLDATHAVFEASRSVGNLEVWGERSLIALRELHERVPFVRLAAGSVHEAADAVLHSLPEMERAS
jgi:hypothetical protein